MPAGPDVPVGKGRDSHTQGLGQAAIACRPPINAVPPCRYICKQVTMRYAQFAVPLAVPHTTTILEASAQECVASSTVSRISSHSSTTTADCATPDCARHLPDSKPVWHQSCIPGGEATDISAHLFLHALLCQPRPPQPEPGPPLIHKRRTLLSKCICSQGPHQLTRQPSSHCSLHSSTRGGVLLRLLARLCCCRCCWCLAAAAAIAGGAGAAGLPCC
jgi:hypothetical protein